MAFWDIEKILKEFTFNFYPSDPKPMYLLNTSVGNKNFKSQHTSSSSRLTCEKWIKIMNNEIKVKIQPMKFQ